MWNAIARFNCPKILKRVRQDVQGILGSKHEVFIAKLFIASKPIGTRKGEPDSVSIPVSKLTANGIRPADRGEIRCGEFRGTGPTLAQLHVQCFKCLAILEQPLHPLSLPR